jgi:hypothetical protein
MANISCKLYCKLWEEWQLCIKYIIQGSLESWLSVVRIQGVAAEPGSQQKYPNMSTFMNTNPKRSQILTKSELLEELISERTWCENLIGRSLQVNPSFFKSAIFSQWFSLVVTVPFCAVCPEDDAVFLDQKYPNQMYFSVFFTFRFLLSCS